MSTPLHPSTRISKIYIETLRRFNHIYSSVCPNSILLSHCCIFEMVLALEPVDRMYISRTGEQLRGLCLGIASSSLQVNWQSHTLNDLPNTLPPLLVSYNLTCPLSIICPEWSSRGIISMKVIHLVASWLHWRQRPQKQYKHMQGKAQIKIMIPKTSNNFFIHQEPLDPTCGYVLLMTSSNNKEIERKRERDRERDSDFQIWKYLTSLNISKLVKCWSLTYSFWEPIVPHTITDIWHF